MAEKKVSTNRKIKTNRPANPRITQPQPDRRKGRTLHQWWTNPDTLKQVLPHWSDEVGGLVLIIFGVLAFSAVLTPEGEGAISSPLADSLRQVFGLGAFLVTVVIFACGVVLLLPKVGIRVKFDSTRIVALELAFVSLEALLHLVSPGDEGRALVRSGKGGGYVGWAVSGALSSIFGETLSTVLTILILLASMILFLGATRQDIRRFFIALSAQLERLAARLQNEPVATHVTTVAPSSVATPTTPVSTPMANLPPAPTVVSAPVVAVDPPLPPTLPALPPDPMPMLNQWQGSSPTFSSNPSTPLPSPRPTFTPPPVDLPIGAPIPIDPLPVDEAPITLPASTFAIATEPLMENEIVEYKIMIINGQEVKVPVNTQPITTDEEGEVRQIGYMAELIQRRQLLGEKRYFTVDGFQDRYEWTDQRDIMLPPLELLEYADLKLPSEEEVNNNARLIENTMNEFDIDADVIDVRVGPTVTQYAVSPIKEVVDQKGETKLIRTRVSKIAALSDDLALTLSTKRLRIQAPVPGYSYVGIEVPNREPSVVSIRSVMETETYYRKRHLPLIVPLGRDVSGDPILADLATMPHMLIAGTTGSGKSVCLTAMITSLVVNNTPSTVRLILLDPKMVELTRFAGLPHLLGPVETDGERIIGVLRWAAREMDRRYKLLEMENARNIESYNQNLGDARQSEKIPYVVIVVDEIGDLMMSYPDETEKTLTRLAQKARAAGMHLLVATQRPSVDVITGLIKANFPARISFAVASGVDSRVILDSVGAETLVGKGDMLFLGPDAAGPLRLQGCYITDPEIYEILMYWRAWEEEQIALNGREVNDRRIAPWEQGMTRLESLSKLDPMLEEALQMVVAEGRASVSQIQKRMAIDYARAARLMDSLVELGIVGGTMAGGTNRKVLVKSVEEARRMIHNNRRNAQG